MEAEQANHRCVGGPLSGYKFQVTSATNKIRYSAGYYLRSAVKGDGITLWHWHTNDEKEEPSINPQ